MAEDNPAMSRHKVVPVIDAHCGCRAGSVDGQDSSCHPRTVEPIAQGVDADRRDDEPSGVDGFAPMKCDSADSVGAEQSNQCPTKLSHELSVDLLRVLQGSCWNV